MVKCKICNHECADNKLSNHLWNRHRITSLRYVTEYLGYLPAKCKFCDADAKLLDLNRLFHVICGRKECESQLRSESAVISKSVLKSDPKKFAEFRKRTSHAVKQLWATRVLTGEDALIRQKITNTRRETLNNMTDEQRIEFFKKSRNGGKFEPRHSQSVKLSALIISNLSNFFNVEETLWRE